MRDAPAGRDRLLDPYREAEGERQLADHRHQPRGGRVQRGVEGERLVAPRDLDDLHARLVQSRHGHPVPDGVQGMSEHVEADRHVAHTGGGVRGGRVDAGGALQVGAHAVRRVDEKPGLSPGKRAGPNGG